MSIRTRPVGRWPRPLAQTLPAQIASASGSFSDASTFHRHTVSTNLCAGETYIFEVRDSYGDGIFSYDTAYRLTLEGALIFESNGDFAYEESHAFCVGCGDDQAAIEGEPTAFCAEYEHLEPASWLRPCSYYCVANKCAAKVDSADIMQRYRYFNDSSFRVGMTLVTMAGRSVSLRVSGHDAHHNQRRQRRKVTMPARLNLITRMRGRLERLDWLAALIK